MRYSITFAPEAQDDFRSLSAYDRAAVRDAINHHLPHEPMRESKSRIKRLREMMKPQYRLRVGDLRVFYDVSGLEVEVLAIVDKMRAAEWLEKWGIRS
jgi:mRNA-degrading endonuclease RelE of RelBE toxin-antitoxin system